MNLDERLLQCRLDKKAVEEQEEKILEQMEQGKIFKVDNITVTKRQGYCEYPIGISIHGDEAFCASDWKEDTDDNSSLLSKKSAQELVNELQRLINRL